MTEAPRRIWLRRITEAGDEWWELSDADTGGPAYVRADIADEMLAALEAAKEVMDKWSVNDDVDVHPNSPRGRVRAAIAKAAQASTT